MSIIKTSYTKEGERVAVYRQVQITFWQDEFVLNLTPEEKFFYLYLMTNSKTTQCGIYELPKRVVEFETGYNAETVDKLLQRFIEYGKILYNDETKEIMMLNWIKYNGSSSPKVIKCIEKELKSVKTLAYVDTFNRLSIEYGYSIDTQPQKEKEKEKEKEEEKTKEKRLRFTPPTIEEVSAYCKERKNNVDSQKWLDFYKSKGWMVGKNKMKDWKACVRTWERNDKPTTDLARKYDYDGDDTL
jgi:hypothetical protein